MSISTKSGDKGKTSLWSGERVWKDDSRVESYGTIDELNSHLGEAKHHVSTTGILRIIEEIQIDLFRVAGQLASREKPFEQPVVIQDVDKLTDYVHDFEAKVELKSFVIPGSTIGSAKLDICRTVARRAERKIIALSRNENVSEELIQYVNRLSDLLYIIARTEENKEGKIKPYK